MIKIILLTLTLSSGLLALDIEKATEVVIGEHGFYKKFSTSLFTGLGKFTNNTDPCSIAVIELKDGMPNGLIEKWTCDGRLFGRGKQIGKNNVGHHEDWDSKTLKKISDITYDKNGNIQQGWKKYENSKDTLWNSKLDSCYLVNFTYKKGKKSGYSLISDHNCHYEDKVAYFKDDKFIGCKDCSD